MSGLGYSGELGRQSQGQRRNQQSRANVRRVANGHTVEHPSLTNTNRRIVTQKSVKTPLQKVTPAAQNAQLVQAQAKNNQAQAKNNQTQAKNNQAVRIVQAPARTDNRPIQVVQASSQDIEFFTDFPVTTQQLDNNTHSINDEDLKKLQESIDLQKVEIHHTVELIMRVEREINTIRSRLTGMDKRHEESRTAFGDIQKTRDEIQEIQNTMEKNIQNVTLPYWFYGTTLRETAVKHTENLEDQTTNFTTVNSGSRIFLMYPMANAKDGTTWCKCRVIDSRANITEGWTPLYSYKDTTVYVGQFSLIQ